MSASKLYYWIVGLFKTSYRTEYDYDIGDYRIYRKLSFIEWIQIISTNSFYGKSRSWIHFKSIDSLEELPEVLERDKQNINTTITNEKKQKKQKDMRFFK
jgi:hypothetical protein